MDALREKLPIPTARAARLATELAQAKGRELYANTAAGPDGIRRIERRVPTLTDDLRAEAQSFAAGPKSVFLAIGDDPPSVLLAVSADSGINAGALLKRCTRESRRTWRRQRDAWRKAAFRAVPRWTISPRRWQNN